MFWKMHLRKYEANQPFLELDNSESQVPRGPAYNDVIKFSAEDYKSNAAHGAAVEFTLVYRSFIWEPLIFTILG